MSERKKDEADILWEATEKFAEKNPILGNAFQLFVALGFLIGIIYLLYKLVAFMWNAVATVF